MRMTPVRYARLFAALPTPRTTVTTRDELVTALAAGQRVTVADGLYTGAAVALPANSDVRGATYLGATFNFNITATDVNDFVFEGVRLGSPSTILLTRCTRSQIRWCFVGASGLADHGIRGVDCTDCHFFGCITRRLRATGQSFVKAGGLGGSPAACSIRHARWDSITHATPLLDGLSEVGVWMGTFGIVDSCEGWGSAWAEVVLDDTFSTVRNLRLPQARWGVHLRQGSQNLIERVYVAPSQYGVQTEPGNFGYTIRDVQIVGGIWGVNLETPAVPGFVSKITGYGQTAAVVRQHGGNAVVDSASNDYQPAPGGVGFQFVP